ncbi:aldo/keto reductase [Candidatus Woesearchaeota archaeon]|nr:aldo/keto reductase [Candidatus Woesearchaeota archaeon]
MDIRTTIELNNGIKIPILGLGMWQIPNGKVCEEAVLSALNTGYRHIDTAAAYKNEESVGNAIKKSNIPRKELFITTKLWNDDHNNPKKAFNESLKKLQLDYVDLYLIHFPVPERNRSWEILEKIYKSGKAKAIGVSNFTIRHLKELLESSDIVPAVNQVEFHPYLYQKELLDFCNEKGIKLEAYSPLTHGKKLNDVKLVEIAKKYNKSAAQVLIKWGLQHYLIVIPKSSKKDRIIENSYVFDFELSKEDMKKLDGFNENLRTCWDPTDAP